MANILHPVAATGARRKFRCLKPRRRTLPRCRSVSCPGGPGSISRPSATTSGLRCYPHRRAPPRTAGGRRVCGPSETRILAFIRRSRELGFTLDEIRALLALSADDGQDACAEVRELAASHLGEVQGKIADLSAMERGLADAVRRCDAGEALLPRAVIFDPIFSDHAASGFPFLVHLNGFAMVRLK